MALGAIVPTWAKGVSAVEEVLAPNASATQWSGTSALAKAPLAASLARRSSSLKEGLPAEDVRTGTVLAKRPCSPSSPGWPRPACSAATMMSSDYV